MIYLYVDNVLQKTDPLSATIRRRSNFECFHQIRNSTNVLSALLSNTILWKKILVLQLTPYAQTARECRQTSSVSQIQPITQTGPTVKYE